MKEIFPPEMMEESVHLYYFRHNRRSSFIYGTLLLFLLILLLSLPLVKIEVYSSSRGIIQPIRSRQKLVAIHPGKILFSRLVNHSYVRKGDTLLLIGNRGIDEQLQFQEVLLSGARIQNGDLGRLLLASRSGGMPVLQNPRFVHLYAEFRLQEDMYRRKAGQANTDFARYRKLYDRGVLSRSEFEQYRLSSELATNSWEQFKKQHAAAWQSEYLLTEQSIREYLTKIEQLKKEKAQYLITAPMDGHLVNVAEAAAGNLIAAGTVVAELSPDTELLADCFVNPMDVGLLRKDHEVSFMVDTYNYNQWGTVPGRVVEIGSDMEYRDGAPMFRVRCRLGEMQLRLRNGVRGRIKKGMTFTARFPIARRSLWQLLYDKADDWLNPGIIPHP